MSDNWNLYLLNTLSSKKKPLSREEWEKTQNTPEAPPARATRVRQTRGNPPQESQPNMPTAATSATPAAPSATPPQTPSAPRDEPGANANALSEIKLPEQPSEPQPPPSSTNGDVEKPKEDMIRKAENLALDPNTGGTENTGASQKTQEELNAEADAALKNTNPQGSGVSSDGKREWTFGDSLKKVLNIDANTGKRDQAIKYLLYGLSAFASGWVGKDNAVMQTAINDFRAKRDSGFAMEQQDNATVNAIKKAEADTGNTLKINKDSQEFTAGQNALNRELTASEAALNREHTASENALNREHTTGQNALNREHTTGQNALNRQLTASEAALNREHNLIMQDRTFKNTTSTLEQAHQNTLAQMIAQAGLNAKQASMAAVEMARAAHAYDEATGTIDAQKFGNFVRATEGDTTEARGWNMLQGVLNTVAAGLVR